jgi:hypothetical protein
LWFTQGNRRGGEREEYKRGGEDRRGEVMRRKETRKNEKRKRMVYQQLSNSWCKKSLLFPNATNPEEPRIHRTKHNFTHVENHKEFKFDW